MVRVLVILLAAVLAGWALADVVQTPAAQLRTLPKPGWLVVVLVPFVGALAWFAAGRSPETARRRSTSRTRPIGPDDDPDFLRSLGRRKQEPPG